MAVTETWGDLLKRVHGDVKSVAESLRRAEAERDRVFSRAKKEGLNDRTIAELVGLQPDEVRKMAANWVDEAKSQEQILGEPVPKAS